MQAEKKKSRYKRLLVTIFVVFILVQTMASKDAVAINVSQTQNRIGTNTLKDDPPLLYIDIRLYSDGKALITESWLVTHSQTDKFTELHSIINVPKGYNIDFFNRKDGLSSWDSSLSRAEKINKYAIVKTQKNDLSVYDVRWGIREFSPSVFIPADIYFIDYIVEDFIKKNPDGTVGFNWDCVVGGLDFPPEEIIIEIILYDIDYHNIVLNDPNIQVNYTGSESGYINLEDSNSNYIGRYVEDGDMLTIRDAKVNNKDNINLQVNFPAKYFNLPETKMAKATTANVLVNGKPTSFEAYNIDGNNYFKLRDIAKAVSGTEKQFDIRWIETSKSICIDKNTPYTAVGGELAKGNGEIKECNSNIVELLVIGALPKNAGKMVEVDFNNPPPITPSDTKPWRFVAYNINGNNYFKLRDIALINNIGLTWDGKTSTIKIDTSSSYKD